jgi:hypothetical protein
MVAGKAGERGGNLLQKSLIGKGCGVVHKNSPGGKIISK